MGLISEVLLLPFAPVRGSGWVMGQVLKEAERQRVLWTELPIGALQKISPAFASDISGSLSLEAALASKKVPGGTAPESVRAAIARLEEYVRTFGNEAKSKAQAK